MRFVTDENIPESALALLRGVGHEVVESRALLRRGEVDPVVAAAAADLGAVLLTNDPDFRRLIQRRPDRQIARWKEKCRVLMTCRQRLIVDRLRYALPLIEWEAAWLTEHHPEDARLIVTVTDDQIRVER